MMINRNLKTDVRCVSVVLLCVLLMNMFSTVTFATEKVGTIAVDHQRFMTDTVNYSGGAVALDENGYLVGTMTGDGLSLDMELKNYYCPTGANALRIIMINDTLCESLIVDYMYKDHSGLQSNGSSRVDIVKGSGLMEYIIPISGATSLTSLNLTFDTASSGNITLVFVGAVSYYGDSREYIGSLTKNECDITLRKAVISGNIDWETVSANDKAKIVLYKMKQNQTIESLSASDEYVSSCDISLNFSLYFALENSIDICSRFAVAVLTSKGEILPVCPEIYLTPKSAVNAEKSESGFKGIESSFYAGVVEASAAVAVVDVHLERLANDDENGIQYILDGVEYYLDSGYVSELDAQVRTYLSSGVNVYFRFLLAEDVEAPLDAASVGTRIPEYHSIDIYDDNIVSKLYVYTDYVVSRYSKSNVGKIFGVILGRGLDNADLYNYCDGSVSLNDYAERIARSCSVIRNVMAKNGETMELVLPVTDKSFSAHEQTHNGNLYPTDIFLSSVFKYLEQYGDDLSRVRIMMECNCSALKNEKNEPFDIGDDEYGSVHLCGAMRSAELDSLLAKESIAHPSLARDFMYCWYASDERATENYILNYSLAANVKNLKTFIASTSELYKYEGYGEKEFFAELKNTIRLMDTDKATFIGADVMEELGISDLDQIIDGYDNSLLKKRTLYTQSLKNYIPTEIIGSYKMWDFSSSGGNVGWEVLYGCDALSVYTPSTEVGRALVAKIHEESGMLVGGNYGSVVYTQSGSLRMSGISGISFEVFIPQNDVESVYEVVVSVSSGSTVVESSGVLYGGNETVIYADVNDIDELDTIKFSIRNLDGGEKSTESYNVCIRNISIHSNRYTDNELARMVLSGEITSENSNENKGDRDEAWTVVLVFVALSVAAVITIWVAFAVVRKYTYEKVENDTNKHN